MDNFLYNIRNNSNSNNRFDRNRKGYDGNRNYEKHNNRDKKTGNYRKNGAGPDQLPAIKKLLEDFLTDYKHGLELEKRIAKAEERKADAVEKIAAMLVTKARPNMPFPAEELPEEKPAEELPAEKLAEALPAEKPAEVLPAEKPVEYNREKINKLISDMRRDGLSYEKIALNLEESGVPTLSGRGKWRGQTVYRLCK